ncbi:MAG: hypothetical protein QM796_09595 [Chthoniobacteraceae bacterium]
MLSFEKEPDYQYPCVFIPSWGIRLVSLILVFPVIVLGGALGRLIFQRHDYQSWEGMIWLLISGGMVVAGVLAVAFILTERIEINPPYVIQRSFFGQRKISIQDIEDTSIFCYGKNTSNTVLGLETKHGTVKMGWMLSESAFGEIEDRIRLLLKAEKQPQRENES